MPDVPILPPGPSEEFLRRQEMMQSPEVLQAQRGIASADSFDPSTGTRQGLAMRFNPVPPSTSEMQMLEAVRQQVNAMHFKNAQDALNASIQFQHMREAQRMRERGATEQQIMGTLGRGLFYKNNNPYSQARAVQEFAPVPQPSVTDIGGVKVLRSGLRGERAVAVPQSALAAAFEGGKEVTTPGGTTLVQIGPNRYQVVEKTLQTGRMTDQEKQQILDMRNEQKQLAKELSDFGGPPKAPWFGGQSEAQVRYTNTVSKLDEITKKRNEIYNRAQSRESKQGGSTPAATIATPTSTDKVIVIKDGKKFKLPASQLDEAQKQGYQLVK